MDTALAIAAVLLMGSLSFLLVAAAIRLLVEIWS